MVAHLLVLLATAAAPAPPLDRMRVWVGQSAGEVAGYDATADCTGPRGAYRTRIAFRRSDGWARFTQWRGEAQSWDSVALGEETWAPDDAGRWTEGDADLRARILGHQFLAMVLAPERVFRDLGPTRRGRLGDEPVVWVPARDVAGHPVELALRSDGRPLALRIEWGGEVGTMLIRWSGWERIGEVRVPRSVRIDQGKDTYRFRLRPPRLEPPDDAGWRPAGAGG